MEAFSTLGPSVLAVLTALAITLYSWNKLRVLSYITLAWVATCLVVGQINFFSPLFSWQSSDLLGFMIFGTLAFTPAGVLLYIAYRNAKFKKFLAKIPTSALIATQIYRIGGVFLILAYTQGLLPLSVGLVSGVLDVIVAITAVLLALYLASGNKASRLVFAWASLSLLDFAWAILVISASFFGLVSVSPAPAAMGNPPLLIISLFAMPLSIFISVVVLVRVRSKNLTKLK
jgi:hypothetical protein